MAPFFSVVIPTYNRRDALAACIASLARQTIARDRFETIVVNDGSTDGTTEMLRNETFGIEIRVLTLPNGGASAARNAGVEKAGGAYIAFTEDDVVLSPAWLQNAMHHLETGRVDVLEGKTVSEHSGRSVRRFDAGAIPSFIPCNFFVKKEVLARVGGYDTSFYDKKRHLYFREDAEFGFRLLDAGARIGLADDVVVSHPRQFRTMGECFRHARRYFFDPLLYRKHPIRYRQMIEVKRLFGLTVHRPQHSLALLYFLLAVILAAKWASGDLMVLPWLAGAIAWCSMLYRYKYQGWRAARLYRLDETLGFLALPLFYLGSLVKGCFRFRSFGVLL